MLPLLLALACAPPTPRPCEGSGVEVCNGVDDDCDGAVDDADPSLVAPRFLDGDGDGWGATTVHTCRPDGTVDRGGDCDDADPSTHPGAVEVCGGGDEDCDGLADGADPSLATRVGPDLDGDGHGDLAMARPGCPGPGWVTPADDCDDGAFAVHPGAPEVCDGHPDNDCDGVVDPAELDGDGDGDGLCSDCDDADPLRSSRHEERCDGVDDDCDGLVDEADDSVNPFTCDGGWCPDDDLETLRAEATYAMASYNPCLLDPEAEVLCLPATDSHTVGERLHRTVRRTDLPWHRDELYLFLPPGPGESNFKIRQWAASLGYRVLSLGFVNHVDIADVCNPVGDPCHGDFRLETFAGVDTSPHLEVGPADGMERRLEVVLEHLVTADPEGRWGDFLLADGQVAWERVVVAGWSIGAGQAAFVGKVRPVHGVMLLSGPKDRVNDPERVPAAWTRAPGATEGCRHVGVYHADEPLVAPPEDVLRQAWTSLGMDFPATPVEASAYGATVLEATDVVPEDCSPHKLTGHDQCLPDGWFDAYRDLMCGAAEAIGCP